MEAFDSDAYFDEVLAYAEPGRNDPLLGPITAWVRWWRNRWQDCESDPLANLARGQGFVLTTAQAVSLGSTPSDIRREKRRGRLATPARGVITPITIDENDPRPIVRRRRAALAATGAALLRPGQVISGRSGAILHGLPTFAPPAQPELTAREQRTLGKLPRASVYSAQLSERDITSCFGAPVATVQRILVDLARHDRRDAIMAADAALRERVVTPTELALPISDALGWPFSRQAREVLALADARAESPFESIVRLALHDAGFPPPELQFYIGPYRVDFYWPEFRFVLEADGRLKYEATDDPDDDPLWREKRRETALRRFDVHVERVIPADVLTAAAWARTSAYLHDQMRRSPHGPVKFSR